jgi:hypothetical protein
VTSRLKKTASMAPTRLCAFPLWSDGFGADPAAVGQTIDRDEQPVRVIGILPAGFQMPQGADPDILLPEQWDDRVARAPDSTVFLRAFARLKDGVSLGRRYTPQQ